MEMNMEKLTLNRQYAFTNYILPSLQPTPYFKVLCNQREIFGYLIQCKTGHSYFGDYYQSAVAYSALIEKKYKYISISSTNISNIRTTAKFSAISQASYIC